MKIFITVFLLSTVTYAQSMGDYIIIPNMKTGAGFGRWSEYNFCIIEGCDDYKVYPNVFIGLGAESAPLFNLYEAYLSLTLDVYYAAQSTKVVFLSHSGRTQYSEKHFPVMLSAKIKTKGTVMPFIKTGIGIEWMKMEVTQEFNIQNTYSGENWLFALGIGGGVDINISEKLQLSMFVDMLVKPRGLILNSMSPAITRDYNELNSTTFAGIEMGYRF